MAVTNILVIMPRQPSPSYHTLVWMWKLRNRVGPSWTLLAGCGPCGESKLKVCGAGAVLDRVRADVIEWQRQNKRSELCVSASSQFGLTVTMASLKERMAAKRGGSNATEVHVPGIAHDLPSARVHDAPN